MRRSYSNLKALPKPQQRCLLAWKQPDVAVGNATVSPSVCEHIVKDFTSAYYSDVTAQWKEVALGALAIAIAESKKSEPDSEALNIQFAEYIKGAALALNPLPLGEPVYTILDSQVLLSDWKKVSSDLAGVWHIISEASNCFERANDESVGRIDAEFGEAGREDRENAGNYSSGT